MISAVWTLYINLQIRYTFNWWRFINFNSWNKGLVEVLGLTPAIIRIAFFLQHRQLIQIAQWSISPYMVTIYQIWVYKRIVQIPQGTGTLELKCFNDDTNPIWNFWWNVRDMMLPFEFVVYDDTHKFSFRYLWNFFSINLKILCMCSRQSWWINTWKHHMCFLHSARVC